MKTFASSVIYVFSIVVAVGIGMFQAGKTNGIIGAVDCNASSIETMACTFYEPNKSDSACSRTATFDVMMIAAKKMIVVADREGSVLCSGCKETQKGLEDTTAKNDGCTTN